MVGLVAGLFELSLASLAVTVAEPREFRVIFRFCVPATRLALAGRTAATSLDVREIKSVTAVTLFHHASTALTVIAKFSPAICCKAVPVFPLDVPAAANSPGTNN